MTLRVEVKLNVACVPVTAPFWQEGKPCLLPASHRAVGKQRESRPRRLSLEPRAPHDTLRDVAELELHHGAPGSTLSLLGLFSLSTFSELPCLPVKGFAGI